MFVKYRGNMTKAFRVGIQFTMSASLRTAQQEVEVKQSFRSYFSNTDRWDILGLLYCCKASSLNVFDRSLLSELGNSALPSWCLTFVFRFFFTRPQLPDISLSSSCRLQVLELSRTPSSLVDESRVAPWSGESRIRPLLAKNLYNTKFPLGARDHAACGDAACSSPLLGKQWGLVIVVTPWKRLYTFSYTCKHTVNISPLTHWFFIIYKRTCVCVKSSSVDFGLSSHVNAVISHRVKVYRYCGVILCQHMFIMCEITFF